MCDGRTAGLKKMGLSIVKDWIFTRILFFGEKLNCRNSQYSQDFFWEQNNFPFEVIKWIFAWQKGNALVKGYCKTEINEIISRVVCFSVSSGLWEGKGTDTLMWSCGCHRSRGLPVQARIILDFFFFPFKAIFSDCIQGASWGQGTYVLIFAQDFTMCSRNINVWVSGPCILQWVTLKAVISLLYMHLRAQSL